MHHEEWGTGDPLLLLHGGFCSIESIRPLGDLLAERFRVLATERPGHGRTPDHDGPYDYGRWVTDALAHLDALGIESAHLVGHSDGGIIGLLLARDHPERVRSLTVIGANLHTDAWVPDDYPHTTVTDQAWDTLVAEYGRLSPDGAEHGDTVVAKLQELWHRAPDIAPESLAMLGTIPVLVMSGEHDMVARSHTESIAAAVPGARLSIPPGTTHMVVRERPEVVAAVILDHLSAF